MLNCTKCDATERRYGYSVPKQQRFSFLVSFSATQTADEAETLAHILGLVSISTPRLEG